jgi:hypothetical protein
VLLSFFALATADQRLSDTWLCAECWRKRDVQFKENPRAWMGGVSGLDNELLEDGPNLVQRISKATKAKVAQQKELDAQGLAALIEACIIQRKGQLKNIDRDNDDEWILPPLEPANNKTNSSKDGGQSSKKGAPKKNDEDDDWILPPLA